MFTLKVNDFTDRNFRHLQKFSTFAIIKFRDIVPNLHAATKFREASNRRQITFVTLNGFCQLSKLPPHCS